MKNYKTIPPKQKFLTLEGIYGQYGERPVVAYGCKMEDDLPVGGYIIAAQNQPKTDSAPLKAYMRQLKERYVHKEPIRYLRMEKSKTGTLYVVYDDGNGEKRTVPPIKPKQSFTAATLDSAPDDILAMAVLTALLGEEE